jgi:hypothetical protein
MPEWRDEIGGGIEPDVTIDGVLGAHEPIDERDLGLGPRERARSRHPGRPHRRREWVRGYGGRPARGLGLAGR